jgi:branched-chain amino acid transport system permease protein
MALANVASNLKKSAIAALWLAFLTLPVMVIRVNTIEQTVTWRWMHLVYMLAGSFVVAASM